MKAVIIYQPGGPEVLRMAERPIPFVSESEVLIKVKAAGINRPDLFQRKGNYPPPAGVAEDIPGLEVAGVIEKCGAAVSQWKPGDAVCALLGGGGYAEYVAVDGRHCLPIPSNLSFAEAAALPETTFTVWHNVFQRGRLRAGESLLIHGGSSGIGTTAIQLGVALRAKVYATAGSDLKCRYCEDLGAEKCFNYHQEDFGMELIESGVDVILDMVGGSYIPINIRLLKPEGRLVFINAMQGGQSEFNALEVMQKRLTITGSTLRPRDASFKAALATEVFQHVWPLIESRQYVPKIYKTFPLEEASKAHSVMERSQHIGKIVLSVC